MKRRYTSLTLAVLFVSACVAALWSFFVRSSGESEARARSAKTRPTVVWRTRMDASPNTPCAMPSGWLVTDEAGGVSALSHDGRRVWHAAFSNQTFACGASYASGLVFVAAQEGEVAGVRCDTGAVVWRRKLDARFQHAPLTGQLGDVPVVWLMSQTDGQLFCLKAADGQLVWTGEATNRCDGTPVVGRGRIAYGNCDGAVYVFDAADGAKKGSVPVGDSDQMAGGALLLSSGLMAIGTRQGRLAVVDTESLSCVAVTNVSQSEAFATPANAFGDLIAMGTNEGRVSFWKLVAGTLKAAGQVELGAPVDSLVGFADRLYVLAGGNLCAVSSPCGPVEQVPLGDVVKGLAGADGGFFACVADGAVVGVKGGDK